MFDLTIDFERNLILRFKSNALIYQPTSPDRKASGDLIGIPVSSIYADIFLGTTLANGIPGVEQKSPTLLPGTEKLKVNYIVQFMTDELNSFRRRTHNLFLFYMRNQIKKKPTCKHKHSRGRVSIKLSLCYPVSLE